MPISFRPKVRWASYYSGVPSIRRGVIDENYFRVELVKKTWRVRVGVPQEIARARRIAKDEERRARWDAEAEEKNTGEFKEKAQRARRHLEDLPRTVDEFRLSFARSMRDWIVMRIDTKPVQWHGYTLTEDAVCAIRMSAVAVVEAIMQADAKLDKERQRQIIAGYQAAILADDPSFKQHLAQLVRPNAAIVEGEAS